MTNKSNLIFATKEAFGITLEPAGTFKITDSFELDGDGNPVAVELPDETSIVLKNETQLERMTITATAGVATIVKRGLTPGNTPVEDVDLRKPWGDGEVGYVSALAFDLFDMTEVNNIITGVIKLVSTTIAQLQFQNLTTTERTTLGGTLGASDNVIVKDTVTGEHYKWNGSAWDPIQAGSTQPNMSETVAGKGELGTQTESDTGAENGGSGAPLVSNPLRVGRTIQKQANILGTDTGIADAYEIALTPAITAYFEGMKVRIKITNSNTGACTADVNAKGVKNIKTKTGDDPLPGQLGAGKAYDFIYDGTNLVLQDDLIKTEILQTTRGETTGVVVIPHSLGVTPKTIHVTSGNDQGCLSQGYSDGTVNMSTFAANALSGNSATQCIQSFSSVAGQGLTGSISADDTDVTITYTFVAGQTIGTTSITLNLFA